jgi:hypothetical protein
MSPGPPASYLPGSWVNPDQQSLFEKHGFAMLDAIDITRKDGDTPYAAIKVEDDDSNAGDSLFCDDDDTPSGSEKVIKVDDEDSKVGVSFGGDNGGSPSASGNASNVDENDRNARDSLFGGDDDDTSGSANSINVEGDDSPTVGINVPTAIASSSNTNTHGDQPPAVTETRTNNPAPAQLPRTITPAVEEDDDDLMIIDEAEIPTHVKEKFDENYWRPMTPDVQITGFRIKDEPVASPVGLQLRQLNPIPKDEVKDEFYSDHESLFGDDGNPNVSPAPSENGVDPKPEDDPDGPLFLDEPHEPMEEDEPVNNNGCEVANEDPGADFNGGAQFQGDVQENGDVQANGDGQVNADVQVNGDGQINGDGRVDNGDDGNANDQAVVDDQADVADDGHDIDAIDEDVEDEDEEFQINDDQELSDGEQPRARRRRPKRNKKSTGVGNQEDVIHEPPQNVPELDKEDLQDELQLLEAEFDLYSRRKEKGKLRPDDERRLESVIEKIAEMRTRIEQAQPNVSEIAQQGLLRIFEEEASDDEERHGGRSRQHRPTTRIPAIARNLHNLQPSQASQKRKSQPNQESSLSKAKKQKRNSTNGRGRMKVSSTTQSILDMVRSEDPIAARAHMDELRLFDKFQASTVKEQLDKLKEQMYADPEADIRRINGDLRELEAARRSFGRKFCKPKDGQWLITGMKKLLHHYQLVGAGWMLNREIRPQGPHGGILADSVGLGKTIEAIACILGNPRSQEEKAEGKFGTLIVVPSGLLGQWQDEIDACCPDICVVHYHSAKANRVRLSSVRQADIVVTTYYEVTKGYPNLKTLENLPPMELDKKFNEALGEIFTVEWHRIILDEAHAIKNYNTHTSKACIQLQGKYRWALTATPLHNGCFEILPYMQFVRAAEPEPAGDSRGKKPKRNHISGEAIQQFLDNAMMVRKIDTPFLGKALFSIPTTHPLPNIWIPLSEEEFIIYK